jgi:helicase SWR1
MTPSAPGTGARRLRARASEPGPAKKPRTTGTRIITADEEARAIWKLSADGTAARREDAMRELEARVRAIVDKHDMAVREKFHLERYVSILEGWDPAEAKVDNSAVFLEVSWTVGT